jgi:predicted RNA-binding protein
VCLAKAYSNKQDNEPILQDIAYMRLHNGQVEFETLLGKEKVIQGRVVEVDFATSKIFLEQHLTASSA